MTFSSTSKGIWAQIYSTCLSLPDPVKDPFVRQLSSKIRPEIQLPVHYRADVQEEKTLRDKYVHKLKKMAEVSVKYEINKNTSVCLVKLWTP